MRRLVKITKFILPLLLLGCLSTKINRDLLVRSDQLPEYPEWFWNMPTSDNGVSAIGYSDLYFYEETSKKRALGNGIENLAKSFSVTIKGEQIFWNIAEQMRSMGNNIKEEVDDSIKGYVQKNHKMIQMFKSQNSLITLLSIGSFDFSTISQIGIKPSPSPPEWMSLIPRAQGYIYAIGHSEPYFHETESWWAAERNARIELALNIGVKLAALTKQLSGRIETIVSAKVDTHLRYAQIVSRWIGPQTQNYHVLIRIPLSENREMLSNQLDAIIKSTISGQSKEEIIKKAYEELERETREKQLPKLVK